jgi:hypothetical protein
VVKPVDWLSGIVPRFIAHNRDDLAIFYNKSKNGSRMLERKY